MTVTQLVSIILLIVIVTMLLITLPICLTQHSSQRQGQRQGQKQKQRQAQPIRFNPAQNIDLVVTWIDGQDPKVKTLKQQYQKSTGIRDIAATANYRTESQDELKYLLRSIEKYAPWIRTIHIVTSHQQCPKWLNRQHPKIQLVNDTQIVPRKNLPTFNSHAIESHLHKIPNLANFYIYACDDMMFGNHCNPSDFIIDGKIAVPISPISKRPTAQDTSIHRSAWRNNYQVLSKYPGFTSLPQFLPSHQLVLTSKNLGKQMNQEFSKQIQETSQTKFRHRSNIHPIGLQLYYGILKNQVIPHPKPPTMQYVEWDTVQPQQLNLLKIQRPQLLCFNNIKDWQAKQWKTFAQEYYPRKSSFEL